MNRWFHRYGSWLLLSLLTAGAGSGCKLGPEYERPEVATPPDWRWKTAEPRDAAPRGPWWETFDDPALNRLQEEAAGGNLDLQAAFARVEQARATARISRSDFFPDVQGAARFNRFRTSANAPSPVGFPVPSFTLQQWDTPLDLSYELDLWGRVQRSFDAAQNLAMGAEAARQAVVLALQADVASSYFRLQSHDREVALLERTVEVRRDALDIFTQRMQAGLLTEFEVERGQVEVSAAEANLEMARRLKALELNQLALLCGQAPSAFHTNLPPVAPSVPTVAPDLPSSLLERRPDVAQAERTLAARLAEIGVARAAFFPSVRLTAQGGFLSSDVKDLFSWDSRTWAIGPGIDIPIFAGGRLRAGLERSKAAYDEAVAVYRQQVLVAFREVEDGLAALQFLERERVARTEASRAATSAARQALARYQAGTVNFLDVVDAEQARLLSLVSEEAAIREQQLATVRLLKALGGGW
jgi:multidrug efflux system outer membrane protein